MSSIQDRVRQVQENIARAAARAGRDPAEITLVAVTKYSQAEDIRAAIAAGITHIGENRVQDAEAKFAQLGESAAKITKHMIGHLQTNKVKDAVRIFDAIQSVDSEKLALEIEKRAAAAGQTAFEVLIEVNSGEEQKSGVAKKDLFALVEKVARCEHLRLRGLMTMAPLADDAKILRAVFGDLRRQAEKIAAQFAGHPCVDMRILSMGMSHDYELAVEEGATMVRIGSAIFKG